MAWFREHRRKKILSTPFPSDWQAWLEEDFIWLEQLSEEEWAKLRDRLRIFVAEKNWEGCAGLELAERMKVLIAAQASLLILGQGDDMLDHVQTVLVYPGTFADRGERALGGGLMEVGNHAMLGQAMPHGPVALSWEEVEYDGRTPDDGTNVTFHEFAHQLDMLDGRMNGVPLLASEEATRAWVKTLEREHQRLIKLLDRGRETAIEEGGAESLPEFFAYGTEAFFELPHELEEDHPEYFELLRAYYNQDPRRWFEA